MNLQIKTTNVHQSLKDIILIEKKNIEKGRQDGKYKKKSKTWLEEAIDTLINCFSHMNAYGMLPVEYDKFEEFDMSVQEYDINRYDYKKWYNLL